MNSEPKVFDVATPRPSQTSRPVIVGHRPIMTDPMVSRAQPSMPAQPPQPQSMPVHQAKVIPVSHADEAGLQPAEVPAIPPASAIPPALTPMPTPPVPAEPAAQPAAPTEQAVPQAAPAPAVLQPQQPLPAQLAEQSPLPASAIAAQQPEFHSLPVAHQPVSFATKLKAILIWLMVIVVLAVIAGYLVIDAGIVSSNINLPFHIFNQG